jgi:hypothetical protein
LLDQNAIPRHSMDEDWGKNNLAKAYSVMKNFSIMPLDTSITNTENALGFSHFQQLNMEQTGRLMSRVNLANYFKQQAFESIGITPQRLGQQIGQTNTATGIEQAVAGSYAQTEMYFIQHCDYLMPRVHQMRTDLAQYYHSTKPSLRLQYMTSMDEKVNFEMNGTELLIRDINVFATTNANHRSILEKMKTFAESNNTTNASIYDLGKVMQAESMAELNHVLKDTETKAEQRANAERQSEESMKQAEIDSRLKEKQMAIDADAIENEKDRRKDILVAEIRAAGYGAMQDFDQNKQSDFLDALGQIQKTNEFQQSMDLEQGKETNKNQQFNQKQSLEKDKLNQQKELKQIDLQIAQTNKNQFDVKAANKKKEDSKKR